ncbi:MAG: pilus assembly protein PilM [Acidobacteriia bacterium]|nr:pilus assembly protein PilM [Terriglobia bacterium]
MSIFSAFRNGPAPAAAVEIASGRVSAASLEWRGGQAVVAAHASEPLPDGALTPALGTLNTHDRAAVAAALARVLDSIGRPRRVGLVIADVVAKVSLVRFEQVPSRTQDLDQLVRWQVRKSAPFPIEEAQLAYVPGIRVPEGQEFIVSLARRAVIEEYEGLCADAGAHAGVVDLATFNVVNAVLASGAPPAADWLLVNVAAGYESIALMRGSDLIFFRNRATDADGTLADLVHQTAMYYEDRLGGTGFARVMLAGASGAGARQAGDIEQVRRSLEERLTRPVDAVDPRAAAAIADRITASPALLDTLAPLVGLLLRDRQGVAV